MSQALESACGRTLFSCCSSVWVRLHVRTTEGGGGRRRLLPFLPSARYVCTHNLYVCTCKRPKRKQMKRIAAPGYVLYRTRSRSGANSRGLKGSLSSLMRLLSFIIAKVEHRRDTIIQATQSETKKKDPLYADTKTPHCLYPKPETWIKFMQGFPSNIA